MKYTRGNGFLELFLTKQRTNITNDLIKDKYRAGRILDIGCGRKPYFLLTTEFKEKYGIDCNVIGKNISTINITNTILGRNTKFNFEDNFFDVVTMMATIEHLEKESALCILKETYRILKLGGRLIITTPTPLAHQILTIMAKLNLVSKEEIKEHKQIYTRNTITALLRAAGYAEEKIHIKYFEFYLNLCVYLDR